MVRKRATAGFTLIELMIVVAIIAVLATVAGTAYRRYMDSGRTSEAMAMLGEIRAKEEAYRAEFGVYYGWSGHFEASTNSLPAVDNTTCVGGTTREPCWKPIPNPVSTAAAPWPKWGYLGINAGKGQLQCGYIVNANIAGSPPIGTEPIGQALIGSTAASVTQPWWYAIAICDNDGVTTLNATFATSSVNATVSAQNEHR